MINDNDPALRAPSASWRAIRGYRPHFCDVRLPLDVARDLGVRQYVRLLSSDRRIALTVYYYLDTSELTFREVSIPRTEANFDEALRDGLGVALRMIRADLYPVRELSDPEAAAQA